MAPGFHDDDDPELTYTGNWATWAASGPYGGSYHYSPTAGNTVSFTFEGTKFAVVYSGNTTRGLVDVYVDGTKEDPFSEYKPSFAWQQKWTSPSYGEGVHTVVLEHMTGTYFEIDAIEIIGPQPLLDYPEDASTILSNNPSYQWEETPGATQYQLKVDKDGINIFSTWYDVSTDVTCTDGICAVFPNIVLTEGDYEWTIQPWSAGAGEGFWYDPFSFTVEIAPTSWTFLVYLNGDNSLEGAAIDDFSEMAQTGSSDDVKILAQFDRASGYNAEHDDWTDTRRFLITSGMVPRDADGASIGEANMGDPQTLIDFVQWGQTNYPADQYALIIWDHGNALNPVTGPVEALAWDETSSGDHLTTAELSSALATITNNGATPIDLLGLDASLLGTIEVDNQLLSYANVRAGSEELQPDDGWPYDIWLDDIDGSSTVEYVADKIVNDYYTFYANNNVQSAVDLRAPYTALNTAVNDFADLLIQESSAYLSELESARNNTQEFNNPNYIDLYDFAYQVEQAVSNTAIDAAANAVMVAINNAIIQEQHGTSWPRAHGISIYFPELAENYDDSYAGSEGLLYFTANNHWDEWIEVFYGAEPPLSSEKYDDANPGLQYSGTWTALGGLPSDYYDNTLHFSTAVGSYAEVTFEGTQVILSYTGYTNRGVMDIYIDGNKVDSLNQYNSTRVYQKTWTSGTLANEPHTLKLIHASGSFVDVDAIEVVGVDSTDPSAITDLAATSEGAANGTVRLSWTAPGDDGSTGTASSYEVRHSPNEITNISEWNSAYVVSSGIPTPQIADSSESMVVSELEAGNTYYFAVRAVDEASNMGDLSNSPSAEASSSTGLGIRKYDDADPALTYNGSWTALGGLSGGYYADTLSFSTSIGNDVEVAFEGARVVLSYTAYTNRGVMDIYIDGNKVNSLNQYNSTRVYQKTWISNALADGSHTLRLVHASGGVVDLDAIEILGATVLGTGKYDATELEYTGTWTALDGLSSDYYANTLHFSTAVSSYAEIVFEGTQVELSYTGYTNRGVMDIYIDGNKVDSLNQYDGSRVYQKTWTSVTHPNAQHTLKLVHASGSFVDLDAIEILSP